MLSCSWHGRGAEHGVRVGLIVNSAAGDAPGAAELVARLARHGHTVVASVEPSAGIGALSLDALDLIAVAGGDGTVGSTIASMPDARVPIALLPSGTANNIAASLGVSTDDDEAIDGWRGHTVRAFDVGVATGPWGERRFVESVGGGLVTHGTVVMDRVHYRSATPAQQLERARRAHADLLDVAGPVEWQVTLDGIEQSAALLLWEALNIDRIGPGLTLADASPFDGVFTVVGATLEHRALLAGWVRSGADGTVPIPLATWQAREIVITRCDRLHLDDDVVDVQGHTSVTLRLDVGAVSVLVP